MRNVVGRSKRLHPRIRLGHTLVFEASAMVDLALRYQRLICLDEYLLDNHNYKKSLQIPWQTTWFIPPQKQNLGKMFIHDLQALLDTSLR